MIRRPGIAIFALLQIVPASIAAEPATYICVEERSVGWEWREGAADAVGKFQPDAAPMIVKAFPPRIEDGKLVALGKIEVTEEGKTTTFTSSECSETIAYMIQDRLFGTERGIDYYLSSCVDTLKGKLRQVTFGYGSHTFYFTKDPATRETPILYTEALLFGVVVAYVQRGTCALQ